MLLSQLNCASFLPSNYCAESPFKFFDLRYKALPVFDHVTKFH